MFDIHSPFSMRSNILSEARQRIKSNHIGRFSVVGLGTWYDNPINKQTFRIHSEYQMFARQSSQLAVQIIYSYLDIGRT